MLRATATPGNTCAAVRLYLYSTPLKIVFDAQSIKNPVIGKKYDLCGAVTVTQEMVDNWASVGLVLVTEYASAAPSNGATTVYSEAAMYKLTTSDSTLQINQLIEKYPYVDSVQPVRNPYVIRYGENLLPPVFEWGLNANAKVTSLYELVLTSTAHSQNSYVNIPAIPNQAYTISGTVTGGTATSGGYITVGWFDKNNNVISWTPQMYAGSRPITRTAPSNAAIAMFVCTADSVPGTYKFSSNFRL